MSNNFSNTYQRTLEWDNEAEYNSGVDGTLVQGTSTFNRDIGTDVDYNILRSQGREVGDKYRVVQTLDYDVLNNPVGNNSVSIDTSWANKLENTDNFLTQSGSNTTKDLGGFSASSGTSSGGSWDQEELESINNGRMHDISEKEKIPINFGIEENIGFKKDNQHTSIKGLVEYNALNDVYFSDINQKVIQDTLAYRVYQNTNEYIGKQSENELFIIMRSVLLQFANFRVKTEDLYEEVKRLNEKVLNYCVENVSSNVLQHQGYQKDLEKLPIPIDRPINPYSDKGYTFDLSLRNA